MAGSVDCGSNHDLNVKMVQSQPPWSTFSLCCGQCMAAGRVDEGQNGSNIGMLAPYAVLPDLGLHACVAHDVGVALNSPVPPLPDPCVPHNRSALRSSSWAASQYMRGRTACGSPTRSPSTSTRLPSSCVPARSPALRAGCGLRRRSTASTRHTSTGCRTCSCTSS